MKPIFTVVQEIFDSMLESSTSRQVEKCDYDESCFSLDKMDIDYPPVARAIMWSHSLQKNRIIEDLKAIQALDLP